MTTITQFQPVLGSIFSFQPTLDGQQYICSVPWGLAGQRWMLKCTQLDGTPVFYKALVGSPTGVAIQALDWTLGLVTVTTIEPHGYDLAQTIDLTIAGAVPDAFNGIYQCLITGPDTFTYALPNYPGDPATFGVANFDINLGWGYFQTSTLVFRQQSQSFEVTP